jgi:Glycoside-hydrolase family GH114
VWWRLVTVVVVGVLASALAVPAAGAAVPDPVPCPTCYVPALATSFQMQLEDDVKTNVKATLFIVDWVEGAPFVPALKARGRKTFCYISIGSWENWRPDRKGFPPAVIGNEYAGYPTERWLDVRRIDVLKPLMDARMDKCKAAGFDGVWFDNPDGFQMEDTGFDISFEEQLAYDATLANDAHARGLSAGINNDPMQLTQMTRYFDGVLFELDRDDVRPCYFKPTCKRLQAFRKAGKATFVLDYRRKRLDTYCRTAVQRGFNAILKAEDASLTAYRVPCPLPAP